MFKQTLIFTVIITLAATSSSYAGKGFSFGGGSKHFSSKSGGSSKHSGGSSQHNAHRHNFNNHQNNQPNNHHQHAIKKNITNNFHKQGHGHQTQIKKPVFANPVVKKFDTHFNHGHKKIEINKHAIKHHGGGHQQHHHNNHNNNHQHNQHHHKPHHNQHANVWWGCHKPVHCHTVIKVPCHQPAAQEVIVEAPLSQVMVNTTIQLDMEGLSPEAGQLIVQMDQLSIPATIVEWNPVQAKATIPMLNLTGPMQATLHLVNADGSLAQSVNVELVPFNEAALVAAQ